MFTSSEDYSLDACHSLVYSFYKMRLSISLSLVCASLRRMRPSFFGQVLAVLDLREFLTAHLLKVSPSSVSSFEVQP
jgi:hypothetical protein